MAKPAPSANALQQARMQQSGLRTSIKDQSGAGKQKIGDLLCKQGYINTSQLQEALAVQKKSTARLGSILIRLGYIEEDTILNVLSRIHNYPAALIARQPPTPEAIKILPYKLARKYWAFPLRLEEKTLYISMAEPTDTHAVEELQTELKLSLVVAVSTEKDLVEAYRKYYKISDEEYNLLLGGGEEAHDEEEETVTQIDDFGALASEAAEGYEYEGLGGDEGGLDQYSASDAPIIKLVNGILVKAVTDGISDIHIEPFQKNLQVRYRLDGNLYKSMNLPMNIKNALNSRLKILANLDITERRVPQDGRIKMRVGKNKVVDFRVSTLPTLFGESVVLRILDKTSLNVDLTKLGFEQSTFDTLKHCIKAPQGLLLVTGPTGSGKTVTLYSNLELPEQGRDQAAHRRGSGGVQLPGYQSGERQRRGRHDLCQGPQGLPAAGPRHHHGGRDPRHGYRRDRHQGGHDRPSGALHPAHQRQPGHHQSYGGYWHPAIHAGLGGDHGAVPASGPTTLSEMQDPD